MLQYSSEYTHARAQLAAAKRWKPSADHSDLEQQVAQAYALDRKRWKIDRAREALTKLSPQQLAELLGEPLVGESG